jgi:hypothetical protein
MYSSLIGLMFYRKSSGHKQAGAAVADRRTGEIQKAKEHNKRLQSHGTHSFLDPEQQRHI